MALEQMAPALLFINGVSFTLFSDYVFIESVKEEEKGAISVIMDPHSQSKKIGERKATSQIQFGKKSLVLGQHRKNYLTLKLSIENKGYGAFITDLLNPILQLSRKQLTLPAQFIYGSYFMMRGYLEQYQSHFHVNENRLSYQFHFVKDYFNDPLDDLVLQSNQKIEISF